MSIKTTQGHQESGTEVKDASYVDAAGWGKYRWWRYVLGLMIILFAWMVVANFVSALVALAIGAHFANNIAYFLLFNWSGSFFTTPALFSISEYHARFYDITSLVLIPVFLVIVFRVFKRNKAS